MRNILRPLRSLRTWPAAAFVVAAVVTASPALADPALVAVNGGFAQPPPQPQPFQRVILVTPPQLVYERPPPVDLPHEDYRSPFRLSLGPAGVTTGKGFGMGLGVAAEMGTGTVGARLSAAWLRAETNDASSPIAGGMGHYGAELNLDLHKGGPWHPMLGVGFGLVHVATSDVRPGGFAGVGLARIGFEYALGFDDADVRFAFHLTGALPGPSDPELASLKGYVLGTASLGIGF
ncbi:hypothetical protein BH09MYX1_BH09MYX1_67360 [soil metagenome]